MVVLQNIRVQQPVVAATLHICTVPSVVVARMTIAVPTRAVSVEHHTSLVRMNLLMMAIVSTMTMIVMLGTMMGDDDGNVQVGDVTLD